MDIDYENLMHSYFKDEIAWLFFQLTRKNSSSIKSILTRTNDNLSLLKNIIHNKNSNINIVNVKQWTIYLELYYRMIGYSRDTYMGLGEQTITYMLIFSFYKYFPKLATYSIHKLVKPCDLHNNRTYGSWRDIKHLCQFVFDFSPLKDKHPLIDYCIYITNEQLAHDIYTWKFSVNCNSQLHISNVAKHIPREHKKFSWIFDKLAVHWIRKTKSYIIDTAINDLSYIKALSKAKMLYRKQISVLNKALDTVQIKLCNKQLDSIDFNSFSKNTAIRSLPHFSNIDNDFTNKFQIYIDNWVSNNDSFQHAFSNGYSYASIPIYYVIKNAIRLSSATKPNNTEIYFINKLWSKNFLQKFKDVNYFIPLLDVSDTMNDSSFFAAIGFAILLSYNSKFENRIIAVDKYPTWISIDHDDGLVQQVSHIMDSIYNMRNTVPDFNKAFHLVSHTLKQINSYNDFINNIKLVVLSDFESNIHENIIQNIFSSNGFSNFPTFIFWNFSYNLSDSLPCTSNSQKSFLFSGYSISNLVNINKFTSRKYNTYTSIFNILMNKRYDSFSNYMNTLLSTL